MNNKLIILLFIAMAYMACDKIEETREIRAGDKGENLSENAVLIGDDTLEVQDAAGSALKHVLLEEFTGHLCGTCPPAAKIIDSLRNEFRERVVVISIHSGQFADTCPTALICPPSAPAGAFQTNFRSVAGDQWTTFFGATTNPLGMIDRIGFPSTHKKFASTWRTNVVNQLATTSTAKINLKTLFDSVENKLKVAVKAELLQPSTDSLILQIVLVEDSVVNWQQWYGNNPQYVPNYVHRDILREVFNSSVGEPFRPDSANKMLTGYSLNVNSRWNPRRCKVAAYLYKKNSYTVIQAAEADFRE